MRIPLCAAMILLGLSTVRSSAQAPQTPPQPAPSGASGSMDGMDMSAPSGGSANSGGKNSGSMQMDKGQSSGMGGDMGGCMAKGTSADGKPMDMSHCMGMMKDGMGQANATAIPAGTLQITFGDKSSTWTAATLATLPHTTVTVYNEHAKANQTYAGVPLMDLLVKAGLPASPGGKDLLKYIVAEGSDGYKMAYSLGEVAPDVHDATVIVADSMGGQPLKDSGPFQIVDTRDKKPARWVHNLVAIRVRTAE